MSVFIDQIVNSYAWAYGFCSIIFTALIYPFSRKWTKGATKFIVDIQISSAMGSSKYREYLVQTQGDRIVPITSPRKPIYTLIMFNLFIVSLALGALPNASFVECKDGNLIPHSWQNDGTVDCPDASDEYINPILGTPQTPPSDYSSELPEVSIDFISNVDHVLGLWGILLALVGPIFLVFFGTRLIYEYCPVLIIDTKKQSISRFGDRKNRIVGSMIGSGAILITGQLILREGWGSASFTEMGFVLLYVIFITMAISFGQIIALLFGIKRIKKEAHELALILLGFRLARSVKMNWGHAERVVHGRLIDYTKLPKEAVILDPILLTKYDLMDRYLEQRQYIESVKQEYGETLASIQGLT